MKILLTGKNGQVGWELNRSLLPLGEIIALDRSQADFSKPESLRKIVREINPDVIVNAAAYTAVDKAEEEEELATTINGNSVAVIAEEARKLKALLIHYSTDYVFDGTKVEAYTEDDIPNPINAYGRSKLAGEQSVQASGAEHLIFRTSWVYASRGQNFLQTILRLARERNELRIVADQIGAPTWARLIAQTSAYCLQQAVAERQAGIFEPGLYHLAAAGETSWYGFANAIIDNARCQGQGDIRANEIVPIQTSEYPTPAGRPLNSRLATGRLSSKFGLVMPEWELALGLCMDEMVL